MFRKGIEGDGRGRSKTGLDVLERLPSERRVRDSVEGSKGEVAVVGEGKTGHLAGGIQEHRVQRSLQ